jgi:TetR/AcrR family transcriptional repressor of mexJK operon
MQGPISTLKGWPPDDPRAAKLQAKRADILAAARSVFLREGYSGASIEAVAAEGGQSKMTVYRHFGSKQALFDAVIRSMCEEIGNPPPAVEPGQSEDELRHFAQGFVTSLTMPDNLALFRVIVADAWRFPELALIFRKTGNDQARAYVAHLLTPVLGEEAAAAAPPFINIVLGDAYLDMLLGFPSENAEQVFERQIEDAVRFALNYRTTAGEA